MSMKDHRPNNRKMRQQSTDKRRADKSRSARQGASKPASDHPNSGFRQKGPKTAGGSAKNVTPRRSGRPAPPDQLFIYGLHTVRAAFENKKRKILRLMTTQNAWERLDIGDADRLPFPVEWSEPRALDGLLGKDAIHQGIVAEVKPLKPKRLHELKQDQLIIVLDQVTDPHNVGAIMRSAVALGAGALITTTRNSPHESGVLAKSASGALEMIDHIQVKNLGEAIEELHFEGFQTIGLDSEGPHALEDSFKGDKIALVLGAEGKGLRHKTRTIVSDLARIDMPGPIKSLNVSNAATLSMYAAHKHLKS